MTALSIVVPCFNEEECLPLLHRRLSEAGHASFGDDYEIVRSEEHTSELQSH